MTTLFEKVGRRYKPVRETEVYEGLPDGHWVIKISGGGTSRRISKCQVDTQEEFRRLAAAHELEDVIMQILQEECKYKLSALPSGPTPKEKRAYKAYCDVMGREAMLWLKRESLFTVAEAIAKKIIEKGAIARGSS